MEQSVFKYLLEYGSLGLTAGLLFWLHLQNTKTIANIQQQNREDSKLLRDRYDQVIEKYDKERALFFEERSALHNQLVNQIEQLEKTVEKQEFIINQMKEKIDQLYLIRTEKIGA
jgi:uncharacterized protein HemX